MHNEFENLKKVLKLKKHPNWDISFPSVQVINYGAEIYSVFSCHNLFAHQFKSTGLSRPPSLSHKFVCNMRNEKLSMLQTFTLCKPTGGDNAIKTRPVSVEKQNSSGNLEILSEIRRLGNFSGKYDIDQGHCRKKNCISIGYKNREDLKVFLNQCLLELSSPVCIWLIQVAVLQRTADECTKRHDVSTKSLFRSVNQSISGFLDSVVTIRPKGLCNKRKFQLKAKKKRAETSVR